jgi:hypothetical protein
VCVLRTPPVTDASHLKAGMVARTASHKRNIVVGHA